MADNNANAIRTTEQQRVKEITDKLEEGLKELFESEKYKSYLNTRPTNEKKKKVKKKLSEYLKRGKAIARPLAVTIKRVNEIVRGWINYFRIGMMKLFMEELGEWLRHKIRVVIMKQWKRPKTIYRNLSYLNKKHKTGCNQEEIFKVANSRLRWYRKCGMNVVNFIISKDLLENRIKDGAGLINPLSYYLVKVGI